MTHPDDQRIKEALASCLSGVEALPSMRGDILRAAKGEVKVKKRINVGLVLAIVIIMMMSSVAVAAGLGLFGQMGQREDADARMPGLETVSAVLDKTFTTPEGATVTVNQAYYDGSRVFISYVVAGNYSQVTLGEGKPELVNYDQELPGVLYSEEYRWDMTPADEQIAAWLDGSEPRWAANVYVNVHDGLCIGDEYLEIIGGDIYVAEDGSMIGWKECIVPEELAADEVTFSIGAFTTTRTYYQTAEALYTFGTEFGETTWHDFTVKKNVNSTALTGYGKGAEWTATATLTASAIDVKGTVNVVCPESWHTIWTTWENPDKIDYIEDWKFYVNGVKVEGYNLDGGIGGMGGDALTFGICYKLDALSEDMKLVPDYCYAGEKLDEAIPLTVAK